MRPYLLLTNRLCDTLVTSLLLHVFFMKSHQRNNFETMHAPNSPRMCATDYFARNRNAFWHVSLCALKHLNTTLKTANACLTLIACFHQTVRPHIKETELTLNSPWRFFLHCAKTFGTRELKRFDF